MTTGTCAGCHRMHSGKQTEWLGLAAQTSTERFPATTARAQHPTSPSSTRGLPPTTPSLLIFQHDPTRTSERTPPSTPTTPETPFPPTSSPELNGSRPASTATIRTVPARPSPPRPPPAGRPPDRTRGRQESRSPTVRLVRLPRTSLAGATLGPINRGYQLCFKCHSGYTKLDNAGFETKPSWWWLDKGLELNPANASFHPIEAAWQEHDSQDGPVAVGHVSLQAVGHVSDLDGALRELPRHQRLTTTRQAPRRTPDSRHRTTCRPTRASSSATTGARSPNTRPSNSPQNYIDGDYALCFTCHTNTPYLPVGGSTLATNFRYHRLHVSGIYNQGTVNKGTNINKDGDGAGNAICAECHFRLHSTATELTRRPAARTRLSTAAAW